MSEEFKEEKTRRILRPRRATENRWPGAVPDVVKRENTEEFAFTVEKQIKIGGDHSEDGGIDVADIVDVLSKKVGTRLAPSLTQVKQQSKKHNVMSVLLFVLFGTGGICATVYATQTKADENKRQLDKIEPRIREAERAVVDVERQIKTNTKVLEAVKSGQRDMIMALEGLQKDSVKDLKAALKEKQRELKEVERELRKERLNYE